MMLRRILKLHSCRSATVNHHRWMAQPSSTSITTTTICRTSRSHYHEVSFQKHGEPCDVLSYRNTTSTPLEDQNDVDNDLVHVKMLHVPWNPADINTVQGKYPSPYTYSTNDNINREVYEKLRTSRYFDGCSISGSEGWGRVVSAPSSSGLKQGELVTMGLPGMGTMSSDLMVPSDALLPLGDKGEQIFEKLGPSASSLFQLGGTALRMLTDFVQLQSGDDVVIQNAGNSGVGLLTSQLASVLFKIPIVSIIRRGTKTPTQYDELVHYLTTVGNNSLVVAEEDLAGDKNRLKEFHTQLRDLSPTNNELPTLALNAVGGTSSSLLLKCLKDGGTLVTYGGMSKEPVVVSTPQLIFKNLKVVGYWHSRWMIENHNQQQSNNVKMDMIHTLMDAVLDHNLQCPPAQTFQLSEIDTALQEQSEMTNSNSSSSIRHKIVFDCQE